MSPVNWVALSFCLPHSAFSRAVSFCLGGKNRGAYLKNKIKCKLLWGWRGGCKEPVKVRHFNVV